MSIYIIGSGFIGSELHQNLPGTKLFRHTDDWRSCIQQEPPELVVNAAGLTGQKKCREMGRGATLKANVEFAREVAEIALAQNSKCLLFSSGSVYEKPHSTPKREDHAVVGENLYSESKVLMEQAVLDLENVVIFRVPTVTGSGYYPADILNRMRTWEWVQSCYISLLSIGTLGASIQRLALHDYLGIFNLADYEFWYLPNFVSMHYKELPIKPDDEIPMHFTQTHLLDTSKARLAGILCERK